MTGFGGGLVGGKAAVTAVTAAVALVLGGCGVPAQDEPHEVSLPQRPFAAASAVADPAGRLIEVLCMVREDRLAQTVRRVRALPGPQRQLDQLMAGPSAIEQGQGLSTTLGATALRAVLPITGSAVTVEVSDADEGGARSDEVLAFGQIVCTLTSRPDVTAVLFRRDGQPLQVPRGDGTLSSGPMRAADYRSLLGPG